MRRRFSYALTAGVLSSGAPAGLLGIRLARGDDDEMSLRRVRSEIAADRAAYMYIGGATAVIFALFGYVLGRHADELRELSETDALTDLLNARGFAARLHAETRRSKRYREPLSLFFLDLDGLKKINDRHGHRAGSDALRASRPTVFARSCAKPTPAHAGAATSSPSSRRTPKETRPSRLRSAFARASRAHEQTGR